jgi:hypothetical protein
MVFYEFFELGFCPKITVAALQCFAASFLDGARSVMEGDERLPCVVPSVVCLRFWLGRFARLENRFVDCISRRHGDAMSGQCFPMRPCTLLFHGPTFHPWCCCFPRIRSWAFAAWSVWMEMDLRRNSHWRHRPYLHPRTHSRSLSPKWIRRGLIAHRAVFV